MGIAFGNVEEEQLARLGPLVFLKPTANSEQK